MRHRGDFSWPSTPRIVILALVGFLLTAGLLLLNVNGTAASSRLFRQSETKVWMVVVAAQASLWAVAASYVWRLAREYLPRSRKELETSGGTVALLFILLIGVPFAARLTGNVNPLWGSGWKIPVITAAAFLAVALPSFLGIVGIHVFCLRSMGRKIDDSDIEGFLELRDDLNRFLGLLGVVIGLAVLGAGTLRTAVTTADPGADFPSQAILQYGGFLTLLLAFAYVPAHHTLVRLGREIRDRLLPDRPVPKDPAFRDWYGRRKDLGELMQLDVTTFQRLQAAVFVLSPLITAAPSLAVPKPD